MEGITLIFSSSVQKKPLWILLFMKTRKELVILAHNVETKMDIGLFF